MSSKGNRMSSAKLPRSSGVYNKRQGSLGGAPIPTSHRPSLSRQSNIYAKGGSAQDPRNINDKMFQKECMLMLIEYLTSHGYNLPISSKLPSGKEIKDIIEFLFRQFDPTISLGKLEDEVPAFFRTLNYPYQISKSALYAAGSPHSWPGLLAALTWLVNLLMYEEKAREIKAGGGFGYDDMAFFDYLTAAYTEFLCGNDEACAKLDEDYRLQFEEVKAQLVKQAEEIEKTVIELERKLQTLTIEPSPLQVLEGKKEDFLTDISKFTKYISDFQAHKEASLKRMEEKKEELQALKMECSKIAEENDALRERIGSQQISVAGVEKMDKESQILDTRLQAITKSAQDLQKEAWDEEIHCANMLRELEEVVVNYNTGIARLKHLYPELDTQQVQYEIKLNTREGKPEDILGFDVKGVFRPVVAALMENVEKSTRDAREEILVTQKELYAEEVFCQEKGDEASTLIAQNKKIEAQYRAKKEKLDSYILSKSAERAECERRLAQKGGTLMQMQKDADELVKRWNLEYESQLKSYKEEIEREQAEILEYLRIYAEHGECIQQKLRNMEERAVQVLNRARKRSQEGINISNN